MDATGSTFPTHKKKTDQGEWARLWALTAHSAAGRPQDDPLGSQVLKLSFPVWVVVLNLQDLRQSCEIVRGDGHLAQDRPGPLTLLSDLKPRAVPTL